MSDNEKTDTGEVRDQEYTGTRTEDPGEQAFGNQSHPEEVHFNIKNQDDLFAGLNDRQNNFYYTNDRGQNISHDNVKDDHQSDSDDDQITCSKTNYHSLLKDQEMLRTILAKIDAGEFIQVPSAKPTNKANESTSQNATNKTNTDSTDQSKNAPKPKVDPSVRSKSQSNADKNVNNSHSSPQNKANNPPLNNQKQSHTKPNYNNHGGQSQNLNQSQFSGSQPPYMHSYMPNNAFMPNQFMNHSQSFAPPYIINQSRISNPPELPIFRNNTLSHFNSYLTYFEGYCQENYGASRDRWNSLLINKMTKEVRSTLPPEAEFEWTFDKVVSHIQDHLKLVGNKEELSPIGKFLRMAKEPNDTVTVFSVKLLQAFKAAYPHEQLTYGTNTTLIERYIHGLPEDTQHFVQVSTVVHKSTGQSLPYETYVSLAEKYEKDIKPRQQNLNKIANSAQPQKFYPQQYKNQNVQYNKVCNEVPVHNTAENDKTQDWVQDFGSINFSVPPPNFNQNANFSEQLPNANPNINYNYASNTVYPGSVPQQQAYLQQETRQKDVPPVKDVAPGVCNYCERKGHTRLQCRALQVREREPYATWCDKCLMKNHREAHCTYQPSQSRYSTE